MTDAHLLIAEAKGLAGLGYAKGYDELLYKLCDAIDEALRQRDEWAERVGVLRDIREREGSWGAPYERAMLSSAAGKRTGPTAAEQLGRKVKLALDTGPVPPSVKERHRLDAGYHALAALVALADGQETT